MVHDCKDRGIVFDDEVLVTNIRPTPGSNERASRSSSAVAFQEICPVVPMPSRDAENVHNSTPLIDTS